MGRGPQEGGGKGRGQEGRGEGRGGVERGMEGREGEGLPPNENPGYGLVKDVIGVKISRPMSHKDSGLAMSGRHGRSLRT